MLDELQLSVETTLSTLAQDINDLHTAATAAASTAIDHALRCGELLAQAKEQCGHGQWQTWLAANFHGSGRTARAYMQLASNRQMLESKTADSAILTINAALELLATPKEPAVAEHDLAAQLTDGQSWLGRNEAKDVSAILWPAIGSHLSGCTRFAGMVNGELIAEGRGIVNQTFHKVLPYLFRGRGVTPDEIDWLPISHEAAQKIIADWQVAELLEATHWRNKREVVNG